MQVPIEKSCYITKYSKVSIYCPASINILRYLKTRLYTKSRLFGHNILYLKSRLYCISYRD